MVRIANATRRVFLDQRTPPQPKPGSKGPRVGLSKTNSVGFAVPSLSPGVCLSLPNDPPSIKVAWVGAIGSRYIRRFYFLFLKLRSERRMWTGHKRQNAERNFSTADITKSSRNESTRFLLLLQHTYSPSATRHTFTLEVMHCKYTVLRDIVTTTPKCRLAPQPCSLFLLNNLERSGSAYRRLEERDSFPVGPMIPASPEPLENPGKLRSQPVATVAARCLGTGRGPPGIANSGPRYSLSGRVRLGPHDRAGMPSSRRSGVFRLKTVR